MGCVQWLLCNLLQVGVNACARRRLEGVVVFFAFAEIGEDDDLAEDVTSLRAEVEGCKVYRLLGLTCRHQNAVDKCSVHSTCNDRGFVRDALQGPLTLVFGNFQENVTKVLVYCRDFRETVFGHDTNVFRGVQSRLAQSVPGGARADGNHPTVAGQVFGFSQSEPIFTAQEFLGAARVGLCDGGGHGCQGNQNGSNDALEHGVLLRTWVLEGTSGLLGHEDLMYII